jgi:ubiquinone/menaquinone biosynthesis C-methylase UbiE
MEERMGEEKRHSVCPVERAGLLDGMLRRLFHNPKKILDPYVAEGMTVLDLGCGPGFFTMEMARRVGKTGKVIAADLQEGMLEIVKKKMTKAGLGDVVHLHQCPDGGVGVEEACDFVLLFYMLHEVPDTDALLREIRTILNPGGKVLVVEPKFHVSRDGFRAAIAEMERAGFVVRDEPAIRFSRSVLIQAAD